MAKKPIYCGTNARHPDLRSKRKVIGTRYKCFKTGVGFGLNSPYDPAYANRFVAIDKRKIWCGVSNRLPNGYHILGSNNMCLIKGIGLGKSLKAKKHRKHKSRKR